MYFIGDGQLTIAACSLILSLMIVITHHFKFIDF
jgi:hypothetical protein